MYIRKGEANGKFFDKLREPTLFMAGGGLARIMGGVMINSGTKMGGVIRKIWE